MHLPNLLIPGSEFWGFSSYCVIAGIAFFESLAFIGLFVPGTTIIVSLGFFASHRLIHVGTLIWLVAFGNFLGDCVSYFLGKSGIRVFSSRSPLFKTDYLEKGKVFFDRYGAVSVLIARFVGPLRPVIPFVAGFVKMPRGKFIFLSSVGSILSSATFVLFGYFFGQNLPRFGHRFGWLISLSLLIALLLVIGYLSRRAFAEKK